MGQTKPVLTLFEVVDTPGMYSFSPITDEERVACQLLLNEATRAEVSTGPRRLEHSPHYLATLATNRRLRRRLDVYKFHRNT